MNLIPPRREPPTLEQKLRPDYTSRDTLFAYLCIPVCYLFIKTTPLSSPSLGTMLAFLLLLGFAVTYLLLSDIRLSLPVWVAGGTTVLLSVGFLTNANAGLRVLLSLLLMALLPIFVHTCCKKDLFDAFSRRPAGCLINAIVTLPARSLSTNLVIFTPQKKDKRSRVFPIIGWCLVGLVGAIVPTVVVALLLSYDEQFTNLLDRIFTFSSDNLFEHIGDFILACILGVLMSTILFGNLLLSKAPVEESAEETEEDSSSPMQILPKPLLAAFATPILLLYVLFFVSQWNYYVSAFTHTLPEGLTYAQYAREGFFQLCTVCVLNAVLLICLQAFMRRTPGERGILRRIYAGIISLFTLILIATALSKLILYINAYGMTRARVLAAWMILLLAVIFVLSLIHVFCKKFPLAVAVLIICVLFSLVLFLPNIDGMIANYNVDAYLSGELSSVDVDALCELDYAAVPALDRLEEHLHSRPSLNEESAKQLNEITEWLNHLAKQSTQHPDGFFDFNIPTYRAKQMLEKRG